MNHERYIKKSANCDLSTFRLGPWLSRICILWGVVQFLERASIDIGVQLLRCRSAFIITSMPRLSLLRPLLIVPASLYLHLWFSSLGWALPHSSSSFLTTSIHQSILSYSNSPHQIYAKQSHSVTFAIMLKWIPRALSSLMAITCQHFGYVCYGCPMKHFTVLYKVSQQFGCIIGPSYEYAPLGMRKAPSHFLYVRVVPLCDLISPPARKRIQSNVCDDSKLDRLSKGLRRLGRYRFSCYICRNGFF